MKLVKDWNLDEAVDVLVGAFGLGRLPSDVDTLMKNWDQRFRNIKIEIECDECGGRAHTAFEMSILDAELAETDGGCRDCNRPLTPWTETHRSLSRRISKGLYWMGAL